MGVVLIAAVGLNIANIFGRYVLGRAIIGADEVLVYAMIGLIFLGAVLVTARDAHLRVSLLPDTLSETARRRLRRFEFMFLASVAGGVSWLASNVALQMQTFEQHSLAAGVPMAIPHALVAVGLALVALVALYFTFVYPTPRNDDTNNGH